MDTRRDFLRKSGLAVGAAIVLPHIARPAVAEATVSAVPRPMLVAVRDGTRAAMADRALETLGGIGAFVRAGQSVVIKPNIGWDVPPERGANTHPELVALLVRRCFEAGAASVSIFDNTCDQWELCYEHSGIAAAARAAGARVVSGKDLSLYREVAIPRGRRLKSALVHSLILDSDVFINAPVLKHHSGTLMTAAMKNLMGVVWDRREYHSGNLHQCIADFLSFRQPDLNVLDAYHPMVRNGPRGKSADDLVEMRTLLASRDAVALDTAAARLLGLDPARVTYLRLAAEMGLGLNDLTQVDVRRIALSS